MSDDDTAFQIGDIVSVRGGNTLMCVERIDDGQAACVWVTGADVSRAAFSFATLHNVTAQERDLRASRDRDRLEMKRRLRERHAASSHEATRAAVEQAAAANNRTTWWSHP